MGNRVPKRHTDDNVRQGTSAFGLRRLISDYLIVSLRTCWRDCSNGRVTAHRKPVGRRAVVVASVTPLASILGSGATAHHGVHAGEDPQGIRCVRRRRDLRARSSCLAMN